MPKYRVEMTDGRTFEVEADNPPSEAEILAHLGSATPAVAAPAHDILGRVLPTTLPSRTGTRYATPADDASGSKEFVQGMVDAVNPMNLVRAGQSAIQDPIGMAKNLAMSPLHIVGGLVTEPAHTLGMLTTGMALGGARVPIGRMTTAAGDAIEGAASGLPASYASGAGAVTALIHGNPKLAAASVMAPPAMRIAGKTLRMAGRVIGGEAEAAPVANVTQDIEGPLLPSHLDLSVPARPSQLTSQQLSERVKYGVGTPPPAPVRGVLRGRMIEPSPIEAAPVARPPIEPAVSHLQQPRVDIGAEKVGRAQGLTKEQVRQQTAPILGEAPGTASPILPEKALQNIIDTMKDLPKEGGAREAYVRAATSGKAQWQIENIRRTLEHLGLLVPIAAGAALSQRPE